MWKPPPPQPLQKAILAKISSNLLWSETEDYIANVICVSELRPLAKLQRCDWLKEYILHAGSKNVQVLEFQYQWATTSVPVWPSLIQRSFELLDILQKDPDGLGTMNRPFVLIGHGLGGLIVKRAATTLCEGYQDSQYFSLRKKLAGIVLFGTPHTTENRQDHCSILTTLLRSCFQLRGSPLRQAELESSTVAKLCESFEGSVRDVKVISIFETKDTKINRLFGPSRKQLLVGRHLSTTSVASEVCVSSDQDHDDVCVLSSGTEAFKEFCALMDWITDKYGDGASSSEGSFFTPEPTSWPSTFIDDVGQVITTSGSLVSASSANHIAEEMATVDLSGRAFRPRLPCHIVKSDPVTNFVGREDIVQLLAEKLLPPKQNDRHAALRSFSICGMGGLGKTEIAIQFMTSHKHKFDATFFVSAEDEVKIDEAFADMAVELQLLTSQEARDVFASKSAVLGWLSRPYKTPQGASGPDDTEMPQNYANWLLVFDDVRSATLLKEYTPLRGPGSVLITSRDPFAKHFLSPNAGIDLANLSENSAVNLLETLTYSSFDEGSHDAARLVNRLDCLPIAVLHAAGVIERKDYTFDEYLLRYNRDIDIREDSVLAMAQTTYAQSLPTVWAMENLPPGALALSRILALLDHNPIQESLLRRTDGQSYLPQYPGGRAYDGARQALGKASLIRRNKKHHTLAINHVVQDVTRQSMKKPEFDQAFQASVLLINAEWEEKRYFLFSHRISDWRAAELMVCHSKQLASHFQTHSVHLPRACLETFASIITRASIHLKERGDWDASLSMADLALSILEKHKEDMGEQYADILMSLSSSYHCLGDAVLGPRYARMHFKQRLIAQDAMPFEKRDLSFTGMAYTELALGSLMEGDYQEAISLALSGREILEKTPEYLANTYWPHWADYHHAWALIGLDRAEEARPILEKMLAWRSKYCEDEGESMKTAYALQILGVVNERTGRAPEAVGCWERALLLYCRTEGDSSFRTNQVRVKLGEHYGRMGMAETALHMFDTALVYFTGKKYYKAERARTLVKKAQFLSDAADSPVEAAAAMQEAQLFYADACLALGRQFAKELRLEDIDEIVMIMSR